MNPAEQFAKIVLDKVKERTGDGYSNENDDELLELAAKLGYGNVIRVNYDPEKHGEVQEVEPGQEIWFWGEVKVADIKSSDHLSRLQKHLEESKLWECECGAVPNPTSADWRWDGHNWQHHHGYPVGHVTAVKKL